MASGRSDVSESEQTIIFHPTTGGQPVTPAPTTPRRPPIRISPLGNTCETSASSQPSGRKNLFGPRQGFEESLQKHPRVAVSPRVVATPRTKGPLRATMQVRRVDPWSTFKVSLLLSVVLFFVWMISVALFYLFLGVMGVWNKLNNNVGELLNNNSSSTELVSVWSIFGSAALIGLIDIVIMTALATMGSLIYNVMSDLVGGIEVTLADQD